MDLSELIRHYRGPLVGLIASWGTPWTDAAEIAQDSFTEAWLNRDACRGDWTQPDIFGAWLRGVARNQHRNWSRGRRRRERIMKFDSPAVEQAVATTDPEVSDRIQRLRQAIQQLPANQRQAVLMHYLEETSVKDVASLLSVPPKTIEGRLYQARRALFRTLGNEPPTSLIGTVLTCL